MKFDTFRNYDFFVIEVQREITSYAILKTKENDHVDTKKR